jgi:hypothetical protein
VSKYVRLENNEPNRPDVSQKYIQNHFSTNNSALAAIDIENDIVPMKQGFTKSSHLSYNRAKAANPLLTEKMISKFIESDKELIAKGIFDEDGPKSHQIVNIDEIGFDPCGNYYKVFSLSNNSDNKRRYHLRHGEHAPFHVSVILGVLADGTLLNPVIIHKSADEENIRGDFVTNLPVGFRVNCTASGYADRQSFRAICNELLSSTCAAFGEPLILYMDGHDSHFDVVGNEKCFAANIFARFLRSHNSINDQPLDRGPNARIAAEYNKQYGMWASLHPTVPITPPIFNEIFSKAFFIVKNELSFPEIVKKAFESSCLYPLRLPPTSESTTDQSATNISAFQRKLAKDIRLSQSFVTNDEESNTLDEYRAFLQGEKKIVLRPHTDTTEAVTFHAAEPGTKQYYLLIDSFASKVFHETFVVPVQNIAKQLEEHNKCKRTKIAKNFQNPSNKQGLVVTR